MSTEQESTPSSISDALADVTRGLNLLLDKLTASRSANTFEPSKGSSSGMDGSGQSLGPRIQAINQLQGVQKGRIEYWGEILTKDTDCSKHGRLRIGAESIAKALSNSSETDEEDSFCETIDSLTALSKEYKKDQDTFGESAATRLLECTLLDYALSRIRKDLAATTDCSSQSMRLDRAEFEQTFSPAQTEGGRTETSQVVKR